MLGLYLKSIVIYWIILFATLKIAKHNIKKQNISLKDYTGQDPDGKGLSILLIAAVPLFRFLFFLVSLFLCVCTKESLDKLLKK